MNITHFPRDDGFGAQYQTILFSIIYADIANKNYCYTPFSKMAHNYDSDPEFLEKKERLIGLKDVFLGEAGEITSGQIYPIVENYLSNLSDCEQFQIAKNHFRDINYRIYHNYNKGGNYNVAVHFRNVNPHDIGDYGYVKFDFFAEKVKLRIAEIKNWQIYPNIMLHIYSQGNLVQFEPHLKDLDCQIVYHLDESVEDTFRGMVFADELFMSKSSLSYCAGLLNSGLVHYIPFWHKPEPRWAIIE